MSRTSRLIGHLFPPAANSIDSAKEGGEPAALDSLDPSRRASISVDGYGASLVVALVEAGHWRSTSACPA
jgi:hypothetical protein